MKTGLGTSVPQGLDPSPILPDILAPTATCELEQEKMRFMARARATGGRGRAENAATDSRTHGTRLRLCKRAVKSRVGPVPGPAPGLAGLNQMQEPENWA